MNIRQAILKAADYIEGHPQHFLYVTNNKPNPECGTPGCMLGWIGIFLSHKEDDRSSWAGSVARTLGTTVSEFAWDFVHKESCERGLFVHKEAPNAARNAAALLRIYADKYHPAESRALIPESVRAIFTMTPEQLRAEFERA